MGRGFGFVSEAGIFEFEHSLVGGLVEFPTVGFVFSALLGLREEMGDIGEGAGAAGRDAIGGEGFKELSEDVVDIDLVEEVAGGAAKFGGEIVFAGEGLGVAASTEMGKAEAFAFGVSGKAAHAAVGIGELAKVVRAVGSSRGHGERVAKRYHIVNIIVIYSEGTFCPHVRMLVEKRKQGVGGERREKKEDWPRRHVSEHILSTAATRKGGGCRET